jgi:hypothetical protein
VIKGLLNLPWFLWALVALIIAIIYSFVWPHKAMLVTLGFRFFVLRWGHALTWILLAVNFVLRGISPSLSGAANLIALAGGLMYALFIAMMFMVK